MQRVKIYIKHISKLLEELEKDLNLIEPRLLEWNLKYFSTHKNRYIDGLKLITRYWKGGRILEIGSVPCHFTWILKKLRYPVIGLDPKPNRTKKFIKKHNLKIVKCDIEKEKIPFGDGYFEFVILMEVFEHLRINPIFALKEINRVLKPKGIMILTTPNLYSLRNIINFIRGKGFGDVYEEFIKIYTLGHVGHVREYSTEEIKKFLENMGFEIIEVKYKCYYSTNLFLNLLFRLVPRIRPTQIIISRKKYTPVLDFC